MGKCAMVVIAVLLAQGSLAAAASGSVVTYHNSVHRHGAYIIPALTLHKASTVKPDPSFKPQIRGNVYAQPLYWKPKDKKNGLIVVVTESNSVYAIDEDSGKTAWKTQLKSSVPRSQLPCGNIDPDGITGTPVIDPAAGVLYFDALTAEKSGPRHLVYALSLTDGSVLPKWPLDVAAQLTKQGASFSSAVQGERSALLFFGGNLYVNYAGNYGDCGDYRGTVIQVDPGKPSLTAYWQTRANGGGIWAQGGIAGDGSSLFVTTGNTFGADSWSDGEAIIRLRPGLRHSTDSKDYFTPSNWKDLDNSDQDLGGTEALPLSVAVSGGEPARRIIAFGKDGKAYLADRTNLGGVGGQLQALQVANGAIRTAPAVYQTKAATMIAFTNSGTSHCSGSNVTMLNIAAQGSSPITYAWCAALSGQGAPIITTTNDSDNAIVWVTGAEGDGLLHGFDASTGKTVFTGSGAAMSGLHHFSTILATDKRFYVAGDNNVYAFKF